MSAGIYSPFLCEQYATLSRVFTYRDSTGTLVNLTGYSAKMMVRDGAGTLILDCESSGSSPQPRIALGGAAGTITVTVAGSDTANLLPGDYNYDLTLTSGASVVTRLIQGVFRVVPGQSR